MKRVIFLLSASLTLLLHSAAVARVELLDYQGNAMRGIVCDNLREHRHGENNFDSGPRNYLLLKNHQMDAADLYAATQKPDPNDGLLALENGEVRFYPPAEFAANTSVYGATREVNLTVAGEPVKVLLARPTVVLVHGINLRADSWFGLKKQGGVPSELRRHGYDVALFEHGIDDWAEASRPEHGATFFHGNGPVEWQADRLAKFIEEALARRRADGFATRRVDIVARSYGGLITRWYLRTRFGGAKIDIENISRRWYVNSANVPGGAALYYLPDHFVNGDWPQGRAMPPSLNVRKVILLSSFWRGVPNCNYLNEINSADTAESVDETNFADAPIRFASSLPLLKSRWGTWRGVLKDVNRFLTGTLSTNAPSLEVIAVNSRWAEWLNRQPFLPGVAYSSIAGTDNGYPLALGLKVDSNYGLDAAQRPSWFPYLKLETTPGTSDGVVPVWTALIPRVAGHSETQCTVFDQHRDIVVNQKAVADVVRALGDDNLPVGEELNSQQNAPVQIENGVWQFQSGSMTPQSHSNIYVRRGGVARLNPYALRQISDAQISVPRWQNGVVSLSVTWHGAQAVPGRVRIFRPWRELSNGTVNFIPVQVAEESFSPAAVGAVPCEPSEIPGADSCPPPLRYRHEVEVRNLKPGEYYYRVEMETPLATGRRVFVASDGRFRAADFSGRFRIEPMKQQ